MCLCASPPVSTSLCLFCHSSMAMSFHPTTVLSLPCSLTPRVSCSLTPRVSCSLTPRVSCSCVPPFLTPLLCFHHLLLGQSSLFVFANSIVVLFSCLAVERHWPVKMRASFLLLLCVVLLATMAFANEVVSHITNTLYLAKLLYC